MSARATHSRQGLWTMGQEDMDSMVSALEKMMHGKHVRRGMLCRLKVMNRRTKEKKEMKY